MVISDGMTMLTANQKKTKMEIQRKTLKGKKYGVTMIKE